MAARSSQRGSCVVTIFAPGRIRFDADLLEQSAQQTEVYARMGDGRVVFYKDGFTDVRGRFDYASVSTPEPVPVQRYGVLVLSETLGATIRDAAPPAGSERGSVPLETPAP